MNTTYADTTNMIETTIVRIGLFFACVAIVVVSVMIHNARQPDHSRSQDHPGTTIEPRP